VTSPRPTQSASKAQLNPAEIVPANARLKLAVCVALFVITWAVFGQTIGHQFVNYDDPLYVLENPHVNAGLSWRSAGWAFTHVHSQNWHPLTTISHMLDVQLFGLEPGRHHLINVLLHTLAAVLLFLVLAQMTGNIWASAFVAAVFAIHPLRVESVAWIAERKDVLSGVFFMLTLWIYVRYVRQSTVGRYLAMAVVFACGLMSKPMLVTTPVVLLLLDYWPLGRFKDGKSSLGRLILEKLPLFALAVASAVATALAQNFALGSPEYLPIKWRITNAVVTYVDYIGQMFWPVDLIPFYLHPEGRLAIWRIVGAAVALLAISAIAFVRRRKNPYLIVGWLWYLVMLVPVIGVIQVGLQGRADRYTYLPQIGLYMALAWRIRDFTLSWRRREIILAPAALLVVGILSVLSWKQTAHWHDTESLWSYTLGVTSDSDVAHVGLAGILAVKGRTDEAIEHYRRAIEMRSGNAGAQDGLARLLAEQHKVDEAVEHWKKALEIQPDNLRASNSLALMYVHRGDFAHAVAQWQNTLTFDPDDADAANNLAWLLATTTDPDLRNPGKALELANRAAQLTQGNNPAVLRTLAVVYSENRRFNEAITTAERALRLAEANGNTTLVADLQRCLGIFKEGKSWREARGLP
jgi:tetratricopeptide (TPR) repeat protein